MGLLITALTLALGFTTAYFASDEIRYLTRAGIEETRILAARTPISQVARDSTYPDSLRGMAKLVIEVREQARLLGMEVKETYTTYSDVGRDTLLLVLTASPRTCLCPVTWKYPVVGTVPYKGFFDFAEARRKADEYTDAGYDVNLRPSAAFSTLGWFNDPLLSTALTRDRVELAALVFHEIAHNTIWVKGGAEFNESFAQWVGYAATREFYWARNDTIAALRAADRWRDEMLLAEYYRLLIGKLDSLYALRLPAQANDNGRAAISRWSADTMAVGFGPRLALADGSRIANRPINNAALIGVLLYRTELHLFDLWDAEFNHDLYRSLHELNELVNGAESGESAFRRMRNFLLARGVQSPWLDSLDDSPGSTHTLP